ncbi:HlyD family secretion protein [Kosakonia oryzae]|uniref:HlyD family secretion protein n=1 Tax=Kosakonia oryzae TaxID=497725 RepID=UPI001D06036D|nr:HlyD family efflux transporter periplasmic adaptor subunit [Kosakonia oryzae]UDJ84669.1 HlyD family efflux transporter periplasmic adaptor subunit [Kosakonia oryzae]
MTKGLFRNVTKNNYSFGYPVNTETVWVNVYVAIIIAIIIALILIVIFGEYSRKSHVTGFMVPDRGLIKISSKRDGSIIKSYITEGQHVNINDVLFDENISVSTNDGENSELLIKNYKLQKKNLEDELEKLYVIQRIDKNKLDELIKSYIKQCSAIKSEIESEKEYIILANKKITRFKQLQKENYISQSEIDQISQDVALAKVDLSGYLRLYEATKGNLIQQQNERKNMDNKQSNQRVLMENNIKEIEEKIIDQSGMSVITIRAQESGVVTQVIGKQGLNITSDMTLATIIPDKSILEADIYVPSNAIGFIKNGDDILLGYEAYPYEKFGLQHGKITEVDKTAVSDQEMPFHVGTKDPVYLVKAKLDKNTITAYGKEEKITPGQKFEAYIILEKRKVWEWAIDPLLANEKTM